MNPKIENSDQELFLPNSNSSLTNTQGQPSSGSTDFVKKLFQMLEDDSYKKIVRWADEGDSFIIVDTNEFTKDILPKHFKHSNFASFVRQLNKYDFHKVKVSSEDKKLGKNKLDSGENIWEFKHPDFKIHDRESLENIKRKGPAQKKSADEKAYESIGKLTTQVRDLKNESKELYDELKLMKSKYNTVIESLLSMKKTNDTYHAAFTNLTNFLENQGIKVPIFEIPMTIPQQPSIIDNTNKRRRTSSSSSIHQHQQIPQHLKSTTATSAAAAAGTSTNITNTPPLNSNPSNTNTPIQAQPGTTTTTTTATATTGGATVVVPPRPPNSPFHVLLVEDDAVCIQLCRKFLMKYGCTVEVVTDGLSAISFVEKVKYDLVLMDIVMPNLDGATATSVIRSFDSTTPIIAMTGNIQDNDLLTYLRNGMTDILAKPFSQHDLFAMLEKHLRNGGIDLEGVDPISKKLRLA